MQPSESEFTPAWPRPVEGPDHLRVQDVVDGDQLYRFSFFTPPQAPPVPRPVRACKPTVRGEPVGPYGRRAGHGPWVYAAHCYEHEYSLSGAHASWAEALDIAAEHIGEVAAGGYGPCR